MTTAERLVRAAQRAYEEGNKKGAQKNYLKAAKMGNAEGMFFAGSGYLYGEGVEKNLDEAFRWFKEADESGHEGAKNYIGLVYSQKGDAETAFKYFLEAAKAGDLIAMVNAADSYRCGDGVKENPRKAVEWFKKAVEQNDPMAMLRLGDMYYYGEGTRKNRRKALDLYTRGATLGSGGCMNMLGLMYSSGEIFRKNDEKAFQWFLKSAMTSHSEGMYNAAFCYLIGLGVEQNISEGLDFMMQSAILGCADAMYYLSGICSERGADEKAFHWMLRAAEGGHVTAMNELGVMYYDGTGVEKNIDEALRWFEKAAAEGNANACTNLALYYSGIDGKFDLALEFYEEAIARGDENALDELADMYFDHEYYEQALELFSSSADKGSTFAMRALYFMYGEGVGVEQDLDRAFNFIESAAKAGDPEAMVELGKIYAWSPDESRRAHYWLKKSADTGYENGMMELAEFLEKREDLKGARYWYYKAVEAGAEGAREKLDAISGAGKISYGGSARPEKF